MIKYYPLKRKSNRWTQKFTVHIFELMLHNSYVLYKKFYKGEPLSHYDFIESIITYLIKKSSNLRETVRIIKPKTHHLPLKAGKRSCCKNCYLSDKTRSTTAIICER
ncbi:hypothetical protein DMUE_3434 [Dictyocoela muelleri]|nr:hypothetical protein DMUE_3434 [Dictyocoela muelleri]